MHGLMREGRVKPALYSTHSLHREWAGLKVQEHKALKGLKSQNLRDHMSEAELIFTAPMVSCSAPSLP